MTKDRIHTRHKINFVFDNLLAFGGEVTMKLVKEAK